MVKTKMLGVKLTEEQHALIGLWARKAGVTMSSYVRIHFFKNMRAEGKLAPTVRVTNGA